MSDQILQDAYARVRSRFTDEAWFALPPRMITDAIYREMRQIDAERLAALSPDAPAADAPMSIASAAA